MEVIAIASNCEEAVEAAKKWRTDVALIDVAMPTNDGIECTKLISKACPKTSVIVLSAFDYRSYILRSLQAGAAGYILKSAPVDEVISAIRLVFAGDGVYNRKAVSNLLFQKTGKRNHDIRSPDDLEPRELEVLSLTARGMTTKRIAHLLHISERTVQTHLINIFRKMNVHTRTEAVLHALLEGWLNLEELRKQGVHSSSDE